MFEKVWYMHLQMYLFYALQIKNNMKLINNYQLGLECLMENILAKVRFLTLLKKENHHRCFHQHPTK